MYKTASAASRKSKASSSHPSHSVDPLEKYLGLTESHPSTTMQIDQEIMKFMAEANKTGSVLYH